MSMEISNTYGNYGTAANNKTTQKESATNETKQYSNAAEYSEALAKKYECVRNGNVAISASYLQQCANDPEKAKVLEENLSLYKEIYDHAYQSAQKAAAAYGGTVTSYSMTWNVDNEGNISMIGMTTVRTETGGAKSAKDIMADLNERIKEKREEAKKAEKKAAEKKEKEEQLEKLREKNREKDEKVQTYEIRFVGKDVVQMSEKMNEALSQAIAAKTAKLTAGFDIKA